MEKNLKKNVYMCITESLCYIPETNTALLINCASVKKIFVVSQIFIWKGRVNFLFGF